MNIQLEKLFEKHDFSPKDRYDFLQIYELLPSHKRVKVVESFDEIHLQIKWLRQELYKEQEILFWESLQNIEEKLVQIGKNKTIKQSQNEISLLKHTL